MDWGEINYKAVITVIMLGFAGMEVIAHTFIDWRRTRARDLFIEALATLSITLLTVPTIFWLVDWLMRAASPELENAWAGLPWWAMLGILLVADDLTQYGWHRASHAHPLLYNLHRAHHTAEYMSVRIVYRNNLFYYWLMPGLWLSAILVYMGFGPVYVPYVIVKMTVITGAHSSVRWDAWMYRHPVTARIMWVLERVISTPATHSAHHGKFAADPATHYHGNYGNLLFFWDVLFGTARITRRYPERYGVEQEAERSWQAELLWPFVRR
ncbi:MAG: fatty acid hydroxylase [Myxococcales bacterium]|nr:fatty acid hydroxylase [Myxococcales bacterium]